MNNNPKESNEESPWSFITGAVFLFLLAWWLHHTLTDLEQSGGTIRINIVIALLYKVFGKWGVVILFGAFGGLSLHIGIRNLWQAQSAQEQTAQIHETAISDEKSAQIDKWVNLIALLFRYAPVVLTWLLLAYSIHEMFHISSQLPLTLSRVARWAYTFWIILPFGLPAIFSFVFRTSFFKAGGLFFVTVAMIYMSISVFYANTLPSGQISSTTPFVWVPIVELLWAAFFIHLLNKQHNENAI